MDRTQIEAFSARWLNAICAGKPSEFECLVAQTVTDLNTGGTTGRAAFQERAQAVHQAFSGPEGSVDEILIEGDRSAWRWTLRGVQRAPFLGEAALGARIQLTGTNFQHFAGGVVIAHFTLLDGLGALRQIRAARG